MRRSDLEKPDELTILTLGRDPRPDLAVVDAQTAGGGAGHPATIAGNGHRRRRCAGGRPAGASDGGFGPAHGGFLWQAAPGEDERPLAIHREPKSHNRDTTFPHDEAERLDQTALRRFETHARVKTLAVATHADAVIFAAARECLERIELDRKVRLLGV